MFRVDSTIRAACAVAFVSVAVSTFAPTHVRAADTPPAAMGVPAGAVAVVNGVNIAQAQLDEAVLVAVQLAHQTDSPQLRQALKQQLIARELFRQNAEKACYGAKPEVQQAIDAAKANPETQLYLKDNVRPDPVTDAQVKARYGYPRDHRDARQAGVKAAHHCGAGYRNGDDRAGPDQGGAAV